MVAIDLYSGSDHKQDEEQHTHGQVSTSTSPEIPPSLLRIIHLSEDYDGQTELVTAYRSLISS